MLVVAVVVSSALAGWFYVMLSTISVCDGGLQPDLGCPANGADYFIVGELGRGTPSNGTYTYTFQIEVEGSLEASSLTFQVYNATTYALATLTNATLYYADGSVLAHYAVSRGWWATNSSAPVANGVLVLVSPSSLSGLYYSFPDTGPPLLIWPMPAS